VQALASVYVLAAAALLVRIQMNVLGRYSYLDILHGAVVGTEDGDAAAAAATATPAAAAPARALLESAERAYLSLPIYLLRRGVPTLVQLVRDAIAEPLAGYVPWRAGEVACVPTRLTVDVRARRAGTVVVVVVVRPGCRCGARSRGSRSPTCSAPRAPRWSGTGALAPVCRLSARVATCAERPALSVGSLALAG